MNHWLLLIEDDQDIQASLVELLEMEGYTVRVADDGQQALELLRRHFEPPSLILLDLIMRGGMGGAEFREQQRRDPRLADIPVVIMSAAGDSADYHVADQGVADYLRKPADVADILAVVARHLRAKPAS